MRPSRLAAILTAILTLGSLLGAEPSSYRWKNRVIVVSTSRPDQAKAVEAVLKREQSGILDRDLVVIDVSGHGKRIAHAVRPSGEELTSWRRRFSLTGDEDSFVLIGKDGGVKSRQTGTLNLARWFTLIDAMPMRQEEMRERRN